MKSCSSLHRAVLSGLAVALTAGVCGFDLAAARTALRRPAAPPSSRRPSLRSRSRPDQKPAEQKPQEPPTFERWSSARRRRRKSSSTHATMSVLVMGDRVRAVGELRRAAAVDSRRQRDAGLGAGHQPHQPRGDRNARRGTARDARRPQPLSGFLRLRHVGLPAGELQRGEAGQVIRGPASAVWGANALYGVVNVISKSPRELKGMSSSFGFGGFDRPDADAGSLWSLSATWADAPNDRWSYSCRAGRSRRMPSRGRRAKFPATAPTSARSRRTTYPPFSNQGTTQPKFDARVDYDYEDGCCRSRAASPTDASCTPASARSTSSGSVMGGGKATFSKATSAPASSPTSSRAKPISC